MNIDDILQKTWFPPAIIGTAFVGGVGIGYLVGKRHQLLILERQIEMYDAIIEDEEYKSALGSEELPQPEPIGYIETVEETDTGLVATGHVPEEEPEPVTVHRNVFELAEDDQWVWEDELAHRDDLEMYVIHNNEFMSNETDYEQETLTYYAGDDVMVGQDDKAIHNYSVLLGDLKFGHGSGDANVVYIRNDSIHMEWEVLRSEGMYSIEVGGLEIEEQYEQADMKHSHDRRFRPE